MNTKKTTEPTMACKNCLWWSDDNRPEGDCRRGAPQMRKLAEAGSGYGWFDRAALWPQTKPNQFCGEYKYRGTPSDRP